MSIIIAFLLICLVIGLVQSAIDSIVVFLKEHAYFILSFVAVAGCFFLQGPYAAVVLAVGLIIVRILFSVFRAIIRRISVILKDIHYQSLWTWLEAHCIEMGLTSTAAIMNGTGRAKLPSRFQEYSYPQGTSCKSIIDSFLSDCQDKLCLTIKGRIFESVQTAGIISTQEVVTDITAVYNKITRYKKLPDLCEEVIQELEQEKKIDRPTYDKNQLHCIGATIGSNFEMEELVIDMTD